MRAAGGGRQGGDGLEPKWIPNVKQTKELKKNKQANPKCLSEKLTCDPHQSDSDRCASKYE